MVFESRASHDSTSSKHQGTRLGKETSRHSKRQEEQQARDSDRKAAQDLRSLFGDDEDDDDTECAALVLVETG